MKRFQIGDWVQVKRDGSNQKFLHKELGVICDIHEYTHKSWHKLPPKNYAYIAHNHYITEDIHQFLYVIVYLASGEQREFHYLPSNNVIKKELTEETARPYLLWKMKQ